MTKKEREQLKTEIKAEILAELKLSTGNDFNFDKYKQEVVADDIEKIKAFVESKRKWHWYLPIIGVFTYGYAISIVLQNIDRGLVRTEIAKGQTRNFVWYFFGWGGLAFVLNFMPEVDRWMLRKVIKKSWARHVKGDL